MTVKDCDKCVAVSVCYLSVIKPGDTRCEAVQENVKKIRDRIRRTVPQDGQQVREMLE